VISDITGTTGMAIIRAIVAGERNPQVLICLLLENTTHIDYISLPAYGEEKPYFEAFEDVCPFLNSSKSSSHPEEKQRL
jgi:hypothetical protein